MKHQLYDLNWNPIDKAPKRGNYHGKPCKRHGATLRNSSKNCVLCTREDAKRRYDLKKMQAKAEAKGDDKKQKDLDSANVVEIVDKQPPPLRIIEITPRQRNLLKDADISIAEVDVDLGNNFIARKYVYVCDEKTYWRYKLYLYDREGSDKHINAVLSRDANIVQFG